jgi:SnoaL-like domain
MTDSEATQEELLRRIDRMESQLAIGQLPIRYALAIDARDLDAWVALFVEDVNCGRHGHGRAVLRGLIEPQVRTFYRSIHQICGHAIDFVDGDHATGKVYCRAEHEARGKWVVMAICYFDEYARRDGRWYFVRRKERHWYSSDVLERPGQPVFQNWDAWPDARPELPHAFPTWKDFWEAGDGKLPAELSSVP